MEVSPLTQQVRPLFQPKIVRLYEELFSDDDGPAHSAGFWTEFFLLRPDRASLRHRIDFLTPDDVLHFQYETQHLFQCAIQCMISGKSPSDEIALDTLTVFLNGVLAKRYTNPSADVITVLAGLDAVDTVFPDFANVIESIVRTGRNFDSRKKAIDVVLSLTAGAYQTSLVSFFTHRDLFPSLIKFIQESDNDKSAFEPFLLLGLLANYNQFETRNPYRLRLEDFVNEATIQKMVRGLGITCSEIRDQYVALQENLPEGWNFSNALTYIGLGVLAPTRTAFPLLAVEDGNTDPSSVLPGSNTAILLAVNDFTCSNKLFGFQLISCKPGSKGQEFPFGAFLSLTSYILHHASRSHRSNIYGLLNLLSLRVLVEDQVLCKLMCSEELKMSVRLCRQRQSILPQVTGNRSPAEHILDITIDTINHNLRKRLDIDLYVACLNLMHRLLCCVSQTRTRLQYHWSFLWQSLLALLRFSTTYAPDLIAQRSNMANFLAPLTKTLALAVSTGNAFLPDPKSYDDLFYKLVESNDILPRFKSAFYPTGNGAPGPGLPTTSPNGSETPLLPIDILIGVSKHYYKAIENEKGQGRMSNNLSPREVNKIIRKGYETLDIPLVEGLDAWEKLRYPEERGFLKRAAKTAVEDTKRLMRDS